MPTKLIYMFVNSSGDLNNVNLDTITDVKQ